MVVITRAVMPTLPSRSIPTTSVVRSARATGTGKMAWLTRIGCLIRARKALHALSYWTLYVNVAMRKATHHLNALTERAWWNCKCKRPWLMISRARFTKRRPWLTLRTRDSGTKWQRATKRTPSTATFALIPSTRMGFIQRIDWQVVHALHVPFAQIATSMVTVPRNAQLWIIATTWQSLARKNWPILYHAWGRWVTLSYSFHRRTTLQRSVHQKQNT